MRLLLITMYGEVGGVNPMIKSFVAALERVGHDITLVVSGSRHLLPSLSVPARQLATRRPGVAAIEHLGMPFQVVGSYLPEIEWSRVIPHAGWKALMDGHDGCVAVLGSILPAFVCAATDRPALCWVATGHRADREDRLRNASPSLKLYEAAVNLPICEFIERYTLRRVDVMSLSPYTARTLGTLEPRARLIGDLLPPVDLEHFAPATRPATGHVHLGFVGRVTDPRKNVALLIEATAQLAKRGLPIKTEFLGGEPDNDLRRLVTLLDLDGVVTFHPIGDRDTVANFYRSLDIFVIPSAQEGLGIVGLEAMACGLPIVSTLCGGSSAYVADGQTGFLVGFSATEMADRIRSLVDNGALRREMGAKARAFVETNNSTSVFESKVEAYLAHTFRH